MKNVFRLFAYEFKNVYKQTLIFSVISTFLFALSISVLCFSSDMVQGYKDYLDEDDYYYYVGVYGATDLSKYDELDKVCDYVSAQAYGICCIYEQEEEAWEINLKPMLQKGDKTAGYDAMSYVFRDEKPRDFLFRECHITEGEYLGKALNGRNSDGLYYTYISAKVSEELEAGVGDTVTLNYELTDGMHTEEFSVAGIYDLNENETVSFCRNDFILPFAFVNEHNGKITNNVNYIFDGCGFFLQLNTPSDIMDLLPKIRQINAGDIADYEEITLVNTMRYILWAVAVAIVIVTFVVLSNSLTVTVNSRKKFMAKLKLLGATTNKVAAMYFILLILSFIAAYALSVLLSYLLCGYFSSIASVALEYKITMKLHWGAVGILFGVGCVLIAVRYLLFRRKVKKVAPAEFVKEE